MTARLVAIELANFRGFSHTQRIDLDADIVLVRGDNGAGKTSLTDGILWLLTGELPHLADRVKGLRQKHDPIVNRYGSGDSKVRLRLRNDDGEWTVERVGTSKRSSLSAELNGMPIHGEEGLVRALGFELSSDLTSAVNTWGILRQDAVRSVLDTGAAALHERMSSVIGLSEVTRFREACRTALKLATQEKRSTAETLKTAQAITRSAVQSLETLRATSPERVKTSIGGRVRLTLADTGLPFSGALLEISDIDTLVALGQYVASVAEQCSTAADMFDSYVTASAAVTEGVAEVERELAAAEAQAKDLLQVTSDTQRLAEAALTLLGDRCPVCEQTIDAKAVKLKLEQELSKNSRRLVAAAEARGIADALSGRLNEARRRETSRAQAEARFVHAFEALTTELASSPYIRMADSPIRAEDLRSLARAFGDARVALRGLHADIRAEAEVDEARFSATVEAATADERSARLAADAALRAEGVSKRLDQAAQEAADQIVARMLQELEPSFAEVFDRLAPHPTFSELRARSDVYYNRNQIVPEVVDPLRNVSANPLVVYSEGQLNTVALSYFLGLALNSPSPALGFMVLDDPLQAMDVLAVLGFADLCRRLRRERQLVITTHDRRYADLLARKLGPREYGQSTLVHEFGSWSERGPSFESSRAVYAPSSPVLRRWTS